MKVALTAVLTETPVALAEGVCAITTGAPDPCVMLKLAVADVRPDADALTVALPAVEAVNAVLAIPPDDAIGRTGLNPPVTPNTENVIALVAVDTVLPLAS